MEMYECACPLANVNRAFKRKIGKEQQNYVIRLEDCHNTKEFTKLKIFTHKKRRKKNRPNDYSACVQVSGSFKVVELLFLKFLNVMLYAHARIKREKYNGMYLIEWPKLHQSPSSHDDGDFEYAEQ